jgi:uncharacterized paraquat-inducible protein A
MSLSYNHFFLLLAGLGSLALLGLWLYHEWHSRTQAWSLSQQHLCRCHACGYIFLSQRTEKKTHCPTCQQVIWVQTSRSTKQLKYQ